MSLNNIASHPKANTIEDNNLSSSTMGTEKLVPSRYALKIGEIDVLVVSDEALPLPTMPFAG